MSEFSSGRSAVGSLVQMRCVPPHVACAEHKHCLAGQRAGASPAPPMCTLLLSQVVQLAYLGKQDGHDPLRHGPSVSATGIRQGDAWRQSPDPLQIARRQRLDDLQRWQLGDECRGGLDIGKTDHDRPGRGLLGGRSRSKPIERAMKGGALPDEGHPEVVRNQARSRA